MRNVYIFVYVPARTFLGGRKVKLGNKYMQRVEHVYEWTSQQLLLFRLGVTELSRKTAVYSFQDTTILRITLFQHKKEFVKLYCAIDTRKFSYFGYSI